MIISAPRAPLRFSHPEEQCIRAARSIYYWDPRAKCYASLVDTDSDPGTETEPRPLTITGLTGSAAEKLQCQQLVETIRLEAERPGVKLLAKTAGRVD